MTTLILVSRPEVAPLNEAARASKELSEIGVKNQSLVINGVLTEYDDNISQSLYEKQQKAITEIPEELTGITTYMIPYRAYNITGIDNVRSLLTKDNYGYIDNFIC